MQIPGISHRTTNFDPPRISGASRHRCSHSPGLSLMMCCVIDLDARNQYESTCKFPRSSLAVSGKLYTGRDEDARALMKIRHVGPPSLINLKNAEAYLAPYDRTIEGGIWFRVPVQMIQTLQEFCCALRLLTLYLSPSPSFTRYDGTVFLRSRLRFRDDYIGL